MTAATRGELQGHAKILDFILGGKAILTLQSRRTERYYTYRVSRAQGRGTSANPTLRWWVNILAGPDNSGDYKPMGQIVRTASGSLRFSLTRNSVLGWQTQPVKGFDWLLRQIHRENDENLLQQAQLFHEGKCCRCGRPLTTPESVARGIGPVCAGKAS